MTRRQRTIISGIVLAAPVVALIVLYAVWSFTSDGNPKRVAPRVQVGSKHVGNLTDQSLHEALVTLRTEMANTRIVVKTDKRSFDIATQDIDLQLDVAATQQAVMKTRRSGSSADRFVNWMRSFVQDTHSVLVTTHDTAKLRDRVSALDPNKRTEPIEPTFVASEKAPFIGLSHGHEGHGINAAALGKHLDRSAQRGLPIHMTAFATGIPTRFSHENLTPILEQARGIATTSITVSAKGKSTSIKSAAVANWLELDTRTDRAQILVRSANIDNDLPDLATAIGTPASNGTWSVENDSPHVSGGTSGTACCGAGSGRLISEALAAHINGAPLPMSVELPLRDVLPEVSEQNRLKLGIVENIGTFTTAHAPGQPRVTNIHRIADITRGAVIKPGETFSVNKFVGPRTTDKGFVVDHVIEDGKFSESVGGGISQYATTLFNAAFFGGLDFGEYQSHSIYISRYPYGREATISHPHPDIQIKNTTPYGVLIWPTYTDSTITVTLYSTRYATGAQTNQTKTQAGICTRVSTERTRTYVDGKTAVDHVYALYQPEEGKKCQ